MREETEAKMVHDCSILFFLKSYYSLSQDIGYNSLLSPYSSYQNPFFLSSVLKATFLRVVSPAPWLVLTLKAKGSPCMVTPKSLLAWCTDHIKLTDAHICFSSFWLDQTEPAPSPHSIRPSWSLSLYQLGSGNLCELLRNKQDSKLKKKSGKGDFHVTYQ